MKITLTNGEITALINNGFLNVTARTLSARDRYSIFDFKQKLREAAETKERRDKELIRECGRPSADPDVALLESEILESVNALGIGAQGLGGNHTALACAVETFPTHIGMLPVAVTIQCHSVRHAHIDFAEDNA